MGLPRLILNGDLLIHPEPLTPAAFAPFGTVIAPPFSSSLSHYPRTTLNNPSDRDDRCQPLPIPPPLFPDQQVQAIAANQATALKTSPVSPLLNNYPSSNFPGQYPSASFGQMSIFSCFPRENVYAVNSTGGGSKLRLKLGILERHPYTTQTFCSFNYSLIAPTQPGRSKWKTYMVVVVAPTISDPSANPPNPPDLTKIRCFITRLHDPEDPKMAVTYNPGTWHAPMIVLGDRRVDFLVTQFANGVAEDDCQEVLIGTGPDEACLTSHETYLRWKGAGLMTNNEAEIDVSFIQEDVIEEPEMTVEKAVSNAVDTGRSSKL